MSMVLSFVIDVNPFKINGTWTDTFLFNNNIIMLSYIGMIIYFMKYCPDFFRFLTAEMIFNKLIGRI